ncbi:MAG: LptF/LptG family permease [Pseudomonadota bacterium]
MNRIDRYILAEATRRLALALGIVLLALVLERVMRLFEFAADNGAAISTVLQMTASLVPHYLAIALPAAFFISVLLLVARLGDDSELDAMMGAGHSMRRLARPLILAGLVLMTFSTLLYGWIEPYSRYGYRALKHSATHGVWSGEIEAQTFFTPTDDLMIYAGEVNLDGRDLVDVFVRQIDEQGTETVTTAATGRLELLPESGMAQVMLQDVVQVTDDPGSGPITMRLRNFQVDPTFSLEPTPFRPRGKEQRELTLPELWRNADWTPESNKDAAAGVDSDDLDANVVDPPTAAELAAELHGRIVSALSVLIMPFLAIPMGMAAKRQKRGVAIALAAIVLVAYRNLLELGGGLVANGSIPPLLGFWAPFAAFATLSVWLFARVDGVPRGGGLAALFDRIGALLPARIRRDRGTAAP